MQHARTGVCRVDPGVSTDHMTPSQTLSLDDVSAGIGPTCVVLEMCFSLKMGWNKKALTDLSQKDGGLLEVKKDLGWFWGPRMF